MSDEDLALAGCRGAAPQRRRRHVHGEARQQGQLPRCSSPRCTSASSSASSCGPSCSARSKLEQLEVYYQPVVRLDDRSGLRRRGAAALAPPDARPDPAGAIHPARRGDRPDRPDRQMGDRGGLPKAVELQSASRSPSRSAMSVNLSVKQLQSDSIVDDVRETPRADRPAPRVARARDHRDGDAGRRRRGGHAAARA